MNINVIGSVYVPRGIINMSTKSNLKFIFKWLWLCFIKTNILKIALVYTSSLLIKPMYTSRFETHTPCTFNAISNKSSHIYVIDEIDFVEMLLMIIYITFLDRKSFDLISFGERRRCFWLKQIYYSLPMHDIHYNQYAVHATELCSKAEYDISWIFTQILEIIVENDHAFGKRNTE